MSIYATLWTLRFPRHGDAHHGSEWVEVHAQAVPEHVEPPPFLSCARGEIDGCGYLAVVFVTTETRKGPPHARPQEYVDPLLTLTGAEYAVVTFEGLHQRISAALRGGRPRLLAEVDEPDGRVKLIYEDGSVAVVDIDDERRVPR